VEREICGVMLVHVRTSATCFHTLPARILKTWRKEMPWAFAIS
jgi:hypothetical protein